MSVPKVPTAPGWWWVSIRGAPQEIVSVGVCGAKYGPDFLGVLDHDGNAVEWRGFRWLAPVLTPAEAAALTQRAEEAESDADRLAADLTGLQTAYDVATNRAERAEREQDELKEQLRLIAQVLEQIDHRHVTAMDAIVRIEDFLEAHHD